MFWLKLRQCKGSVQPQFLISCRQIWQTYKIIAEDENRPGHFEIPLQLFFMTQTVQFCMLQMGIFLQTPAESSR